jgi:hypothetical protein
VEYRYSLACGAIDPIEHQIRLAAEPKRWMSVTAPVAASLRLTPVCLIRCVAMTL